MRITKKKIVGAVAVSAVVALGAGSAYAFWTTTGTGSGTAAVGTDEGFTISGDIAPELLLDVEQTFDITVTNDATFPQHLTNLGFTINATNVGCDESWFILTQPTVPVGGVDVAANGGTAIYGAAIQLDNLTSTNQDACKDSPIEITYQSS
jgi:hypothetical protein